MTNNPQGQMPAQPTNTASGAELIAAAQAVVDRWDTPLWKDVPATAEYIGRLRAALESAAAPAEQPNTAYAGMPDDRESFKAYLKECDECAIVPDVAGAFNAAWQIASRGQAPAQAAPAAVAGQSEMHEAMCPALTGGRCTCERNDPAVDKAWARFCGGIGDGPDAPYPGMISAFERYYSQSFTDKDWRNEASVWAAAWKKALLTAAAPTTQPAPQQEARPVTPYTCPKCHALWLHWPAEQSGFGMDTLNCRSTTHCDYCEKGGVEQLERLERVPAALKAPQQEAQEPVAWYVTGCSRLLDEDEAKAEARRIGGTARAMPLYTAPQADSQPAPANTRQIAECYGDCPEDPKTCRNQCKFEGRAARAPADSVTAPAAYSGNIEQELAMLIRRIVSSARRNCEDGSNVLKLANEAWVYLVRKGLNGSPLRDAGIESDPTPAAQAADSVLEDAARYRHIRDVPHSEEVRSVLIHQQNAVMDKVIDKDRAAMAAKKGETHE